MATKYKPKKSKFLVIYPCTTVKPYSASRSYKQLYSQLDRLNGKREQVKVMAISEPFGLVPEEFFSKFTWYDCPGLFEWWCKKNGQEYEREFLEKSLEILSDAVGLYLKRAVKNRFHERVIGLVRTFSSSLEKKHDHTHRRMLEMASEKYNIDIEMMPSRTQVKNLVGKNGFFAWDMYGVAHTEMLKKLVSKIQTS